MSVAEFFWVHPAFRAMLFKKEKPLSKLYISLCLI